MTPIISLTSDDSITIIDSVYLNKTVATVYRSINLSDTISISDSVSLDKTTAPISYYVNVSDSITITDSVDIIKIITHNVNVFDSITITDSVFLNKTVNYYVNVSDTFTLADIVSMNKTTAVVNYYVNVSETITISDSIFLNKTSAPINYYLNLSDSITVTDSVDIVKKFSYVVNEFDSITITDSVFLNKTNAIVSYDVHLNDSITITDLVFLNKTIAFISYGVYLDDSIAISDSVYINKIPFSYVPVVTLLSMTPSVIYENSTGTLNISYGITHGSGGLNNTSIAFRYRNYDHDLGTSNHSIRPPDNTRAAVWNLDGQILRGQNRNNTLNWEDNVTITEGDIYTWSGLDENSTRLTIVPYNSTYTYVYINATVHDIMPNMWYIDRTQIETVAKTPLAIHKTQNVLIKFWDFEIFKGNTDFLGVGYTDTLLNDNPALHPSDVNPIEFFYVNSSYNPATDGDPLESGYAVFMGSLNASGWVDHVYNPTPNANYVRGFINNNLIESMIDTTEVSYLYFTSNTPSSKPYYINMTDVATDTNVSFANTNVLWAGNDAPFTPFAYTPNVWFSFMKPDLTLDHQLFVADNNDLWNNSTMNRTNITQSLFPPTKPVIDHFHFPTPADWDTEMNKTYTGTFGIGVAVGSDPDGGIVTHNLTLHYANQTFIATINNTFNESDLVHNGVYVNIEFDSSSYYSTIEKYTLKVVATDDEAVSTYSWLGVNFSLLEGAESPSNLQNTSGNFWINYTWDTSISIDSFNVSINSSWTNGSTDTYSNNTTVPHGHIEIIVYGYNNSVGLSLTNVTDNVTIPNNPITITNTSDFNVYEGDNVYIDYDAIDADSDTPMFTCNRTDLFTDFSSVTGQGNWIPGFDDDGIYYVDMGVSDGYGSSDNYTMTIVVYDEAIGFISYWNNISGYNLDFNVDEGTSCEFQVIVNHTAVNISWYNGSAFVGNNSSTIQGDLTLYWETVGLYTVNVTAVDEYGSTGNITFNVNVITTITSLSGYVYYSPGGSDVLYLNDAVVTAGSYSTTSDASGYYNFGYVFVSGNKTITVDRYYFIDNISVVDISGDYVYNVSMTLNPIEVPGAETRLSLGVVIPVLSILMASVVFRLKRKGD